MKMPGFNAGVACWKSTDSEPLLPEKAGRFCSFFAGSICCPSGGLPGIFNVLQYNLHSLYNDLLMYKSGKHDWRVPASFESITGEIKEKETAPPSEENL